MSECCYQRAGDGLLGLLGAQLLHGVVVLLLLRGHEDVLTSKVKGAQHNLVTTTKRNVFSWDHLH